MALTTGSNAQVVLQANFNVLKTLVFGGTAVINDNMPAVNAALSIGAGANQFNVEYCQQDLALVSGTPLAINLTSGLTASNGQSITFADIVLLAVSCPATNSANVTLGGGTNDVTSILGASGTLTIIPGATVFIFAPVASGYGVTATTACILQFAAASGTQAVNVMVAGH